MKHHADDERFKMFRRELLLAGGVDECDRRGGGILGMRSFTYERARTSAWTAATVARTPGAKFIAGGTNLLDLMKLQIETPRHLVDVNVVGLDRIEPTARGLGTGGRSEPR